MGKNEMTPKYTNTHFVCPEACHAYRHARSGTDIVPGWLSLRLFLGAFLGAGGWFPVHLLPSF